MCIIFEAKANSKWHNFLKNKYYQNFQIDLTVINTCGLNDI